MHEHLDESVVQRLRAASSEFAARRGLDPASEEIANHLEDKLLGYLNGEIAISADDALLLVYAHFGDARGLTRQLRAAQVGQPPSSGLQRNLVRSAVLTAAFTLLGLPLAWLMFTDAAGNPGQLVTAAAILFGCLAVCESGLLLASWADLERVWQRAVAALFLLPGIAMLLTLLVGQIQHMTNSYGLANQRACAILAAVEMACLSGHILVMALLALAPYPVNPESSANRSFRSE